MAAGNLGGVGGNGGENDGQRKAGFYLTKFNKPRDYV